MAVWIVIPSVRVPQSQFAVPDGAPRWFGPVVLTLGVLGFVATLGLRSSQRSLAEEAQTPQWEAQEWTVEVDPGMDLTQRLPQAGDASDRNS